MEWRDTDHVQAEETSISWYYIRPKGLFPFCTFPCSMGLEVRKCHGEELRTKVTLVSILPISNLILRFSYSKAQLSASQQQYAELQHGNRSFTLPSPRQSSATHLHYSHNNPIFHSPRFLRTLTCQGQIRWPFNVTTCISLGCGRKFEQRRKVTNC